MASKNAASSKPICVHPDNPHYFLFRGKPTILITSAEHYGAVINLDFRYVDYLDALDAKNLNYTRIYPGAYFETDGYFAKDNPLGPRIDRHLMPWARSSIPGYPLGGNKFDLDTWDASYFERLRDFVAKAGERGIVVEVCFFNCMYPEMWPVMPLYHDNNIQGVGTCACNDVQTLKDAALVARHEAYVRKITTELNQFDNVVLEICDEPAVKGTPHPAYVPWILRLLQTIVETERRLPNKHMVAQQVCGTLDGAGDFSRNPDVSIITGQYVGMTDGEQFGGMTLLDAKYDLNKPIELNETAYFPMWYEGDKIAASRVEAWEFVVGGGAGFNHLNSLFSTPDAAGERSGVDEVLDIYENLHDFMYGFDFVKMHRDTTLIAGGVSLNAVARAMSEPGKQYALYIHHPAPREGEKCVKYVVVAGDYQERLHLNIAAGKYRADWVDPATGSIVKTDTIDHEGGVRAIDTPQYTVDMALRIVGR